MSHELGTPVNAVLGFAQLLELDDLSPDQRESVADILKAGSTLSTKWGTAPPRAAAAPSCTSRTTWSISGWSKQILAQRSGVQAVGAMHGRLGPEIPRE